MLLCGVIPPAWRSVVKGAVSGVRCFAGLCVGDLWSSKHVVPYTEVLLGFAGSEETVGTRPTGDGRCWGIEVGTLVPGRCLGLDGTGSMWTNGCIVKDSDCSTSPMSSLTQMRVQCVTVCLCSTTTTTTT